MPNIGLAQWCIASSFSEAIRVCDALGCQILHAETGDMSSPTWLGIDSVLHEALLVQVDYNVRVVALSANELCDTGLVHPPTTTKARHAERIVQTTIDIAVAMGVSRVVLPSFFDGEIKTEADLDNTQYQLEQALAYAASYSVDIVTENGLNISQQRHLLAQLPGLQLLFDTQNSLVFGQSPHTQFKELHPHCCNVIHIKDGSEDTFGDRLLTQGIVPLAELVGLVRYLKPSADWIVETEYVEMQGDLYDLVRQDMATLEQL